MTAGKDPAECAESASPAPTLIGATTPGHPLGFEKPSDQGEREIQSESADNYPLHGYTIDDAQSADSIARQKVG